MGFLASLRAAGIRIYWLPTYSPDYNTMETVFANDYVKNLCRQNADLARILGWSQEQLIHAAFGAHAALSVDATILAWATITAWRNLSANSPFPNILSLFNLFVPSRCALNSKRSGKCNRN